jgi:hypothetical protein
MERVDTQNSRKYDRSPAFTKYRRATRASGVKGRSGVAALGADEIAAPFAEPDAAATGSDLASLAGVRAVPLVAAKFAGWVLKNHVVFHDLIEYEGRDSRDEQVDFSRFIGRRSNLPPFGSIHA